MPEISYRLVKTFQTAHEAARKWLAQGNGWDLDRGEDFAKTTDGHGYGSGYEIEIVGVSGSPPKGWIVHETWRRKITAVRWGRVRGWEYQSPEDATLEPRTAEEDS